MTALVKWRVILIKCHNNDWDRRYCFSWFCSKKSCLMTKPIKWNVRPVKTQISLGIHLVWSVFAVRMKKPWVLSYPLSVQRRLWSDWAFCWFCHEVAQMFYCLFNCVTPSRLTATISMFSNHSGVARIGVNVTGLDELQNAKLGLNHFMKSWNWFYFFKVNTRDSKYANFKTCIYL